MQSKTKIFAAFLLIFSLSLGLFFSLVANDVEAGEVSHKIDICHSTSAHTNPYGPKKISIDKSAVITEGHSGHTGPIWFKGITVGWGDIIPPFEYEDSCPPNGSDAYDSDNCGKEGYTCKQGNNCASPIPGGSYPGMNWDEEGQAIWNNSCATHNLKLTSICYDDVEEYRVWRVFHKDSSDKFFPIQLGYKIYPSNINSIDTLFGFNHNEATKFTDPFYFETPYDGNSQTVILFWKNTQENKWVQSETKSSNNEICEREPECEVTSDEFGTWSEWAVDPSDTTKEYRERTVTKYDSKVSEYVCSSDLVREERPRALCEWDETIYADDPLCLASGDGEPTPDTDSDEGEVAGVSTVNTGEVKGTTTVVLASTAGGDRYTIYLVQSVLLLLSSMSLIYVGREYLNRFNEV